MGAALRGGLEHNQFRSLFHQRGRFGYQRVHCLVGPRSAQGRLRRQHRFPIAEIANLREGQVLREGTFDLFGTASNLDQNVGVDYHLRLYLPNNGQTQPAPVLIADLTPPHTGPAGRKLNELLGRLDFSCVRNGAYLLELEVDSIVGGQVFNTVLATIS